MASVLVVQIEFSPRHAELLDVLRTKTDASSYEKVIKDALGLYWGMIEEMENGKRFLTLDEDDVVSFFSPFLEEENS